MEVGLDITILIEKTKKGDNLKFADVKLYHKECKGGSIESKREGRLISDDLILCCRRCHAECKVLKENENDIKAEIIKTSQDGKERTVIVEKDGKSDFSISLFQRDPSTDEIATVPEDQTLSLDLSDD
jgi:hypothetical protein